MINCGEHNDEFHDEIFTRNRKQREKPPLWDSFQDPPSKRAMGSATIWNKLNLVLKICKLFTYLLVFSVILCTAVASKLSYVLMASQLNDKPIVQFCNGVDENRKYRVYVSREERITWIWSLVISFSFPEILTFFRSLRIYTFKDIKTPTWVEVVLVITFELFHVVGLAILTFIVLPKLDSCQALMITTCVCFVPLVLRLTTGLQLQFQSILGLVVSVSALLGLLTSFIAWPMFSELLQVQILAIPLILISFRWWENYINANSSIVSLIKTIRRTKSRYQTYLYLSPLKIMLFGIIAFMLQGGSMRENLGMFSELWRNHEIVLRSIGKNSTSSNSIDKIFVESEWDFPIIMVFIQIASSYLCYIFAKFACKIKIQEFSFSLPLSLSGPVSVCCAVLLARYRELNFCAFHNYLPDYVSVNGSESYVNLLDGLVTKLLWLWPLWWLTQLWIVRHIWRPKNDKNAPTEKLFMCPWYCGFLVDQCIQMNRRIIDWNEEYLSIKNESIAKVNEKNKGDVLENDKIPQVIICATMWHETQEEMMEFLKSIIRLDEDQCARRMAMLHINNGKPDEGYYELESNIFFDDAFVLDDKLCEDPKNPPLNEYVKILITSIEKAAFEVYGVNMRMKPPIKIETPYGGRLVWTLPGRSKLVAHLKNKDKIRHKKRWSQVMYMYYLLGYRIMEMENVSPKRKAVIAENTFLLALDGDIDFQPRAVQLLIDRMKVVDELGAACGRIHPVGRGPMVWYQIFEYAIGHWLQKATEHVIGCVLCSPGCFSLFRGSALMENSVMKKYTTVSQEPMHYVQYDQGEDRWLCTLILKQGLRVEYAAASDAYTHSPESYNEFCNQRRRWIPSTIANIFDLLSDADMVVKNNSSISTPYVGYQAMLMVGTILGPGTIFLMMVGSLVTVFNIDIWTAFLWNFFPVLSFILSCIYLKQKFQLLLSFVISSMYCLVMMAVLIGIIIQMIDDGPLAPASLFFLLVFMQIFIAGVVHPQEVTALICGFIYYITIPSMYMLLLIYSVFNMNDVSWGTREVAPKKEDDGAMQVIQDGDSQLGDGDNQRTQNYIPGWVNDPLLVDSELGEISLREKRFWRDLIKLYLRPLFHTKEKKAEIAESLRELRNMFAFAFIMINSIFVLVVFLLQIKKNYLHLEWPIDPTDFITYDDVNSQIYIYRQYKELDPIGMCFVVFFGLILIIQFMAMFFHRFETMSQLLANTHLDWFRSPSSMTDEDAVQEIRGNAVNIARQLQRPQRFDDDDDDDMNGCNERNNGTFDESQNDSNQDKMTRRHTIFKLHQNLNRAQQDYSDLPRNFERRFFGDDEIKVNHLSMSRKSMLILNEARSEAKRRLTQQMPAKMTNFERKSSAINLSVTTPTIPTSYQYDNLSFEVPADEW